MVGTDPLLSNVTVRGEASGVKYHSSGHVYFSIVDEGSKLNCFLPRDYARTLKLLITDGMELILTGGVSIYKKGGSYSLYIRNLEIAGEGALAVAFEQMKQRLSAEGLFDPSHKKPLPFFPRHVGVITASTGAAIRDILKILRSRNDVTDVTLFPTAVQGEGAGMQIARTIDAVNEKYPDIDVLIVGRGGGSAEDLWAFNEECVARSIYGSRIPVISAVGHEIDITIADLVADVRAETPTAAAQIAVPDTAELMTTIEDLKKQMALQLSNHIMYQSLLTENLLRAMKDGLSRRIDGAAGQVERYWLMMKENDPRNRLANGYASVEDEEGSVITDAGLLQRDRRYKVTFRKGTAVMTLAEEGMNHGE